MPSIENYNAIMSDRKLFNETVYTPLSEALKLLEERQKDPKLMAKIEELLKGDIPEILRNKKCGVMARQVATPNYDVRSFVSISLDNKLNPIFFEYTDDKFIADNEFKHSLGQLRIHSRADKTGNFIEEKINIIDFNINNGKKLKEIKTLNGESLLDFHKKLFEVYKIDNNIHFIDGSEWVKRNGIKANLYYPNVLLLFVCHGILFENFMLNGSEGEFSKKVVLPAIEKVLNITGVKPLIVPIPPMDMEEDGHWLSHDSVIKKFLVNNK